MNARFTRLLGVISFMLLCSCVETGEPTKPHAPDKSTSFQVDAGPAVEAQASSLPIWVDPTDSSSGLILDKDLHYWQRAVDSADNPFADVLLWLARVLWSPAVMQNPRVAGTEFYQRTLRFLHAELLNHLDKKEPRSEVISLLSNGIGKDCLEQLRNCSSLAALQRDTGSAQLLSRLILNAQDDIPDDVRRSLVLISIDLIKSKPIVPELEEMVFRESNLLTSLKDQPESNVHHRIQAWSDFLVNSLSRYAAETRNVSIPNYVRDYMIQSNWQKALTSENPVMGVDQKTALRLALRAGLFEDGFQKIHQEWGRKSPFSVALKKLKQEQSALYGNLELLEPTRVIADSEFFVIDGVFGRRLSAEAGAELLLQMNLGAERFHELLSQYIQLRFALLIAKTSDYMAAELKRNDITTIQFYIDVVQRSKGIAIQWEALVRDAGELRRLGLIFLDLIPYSKNREQIRLEVESLITSLPMNIKQTAVYPNMLMMIYYLAQANFDVSIKTFFGVFSIKTDDILLSLMTGSLYPFFRFGTDGQPMGFVDVLYSVVYALKTDTFKTFGIDKTDFLKMLADKYLEEDAGVIRDDLKKIRTHFESHQAAYRRFQTVCGTLAKADCANDPDSHPVCQNQAVLSKASDHLPELWFQAEELRSRVFHGMPGNTITVSGGKEYGPSGISPEFISGTLFYLIPGKNTDFAQNLSNTMEIARADLREKMRILDVIIQMSVKHLKERGDAADAERTERTMREHMSPYRSLLSDFMSEVLQRELEIGDCYSYMSRKEQEFRDRIFEAEERHLRFVHRQMKKARAADASLEELNAALFTGSETYDRLRSLDWYRAFAIDHQSNGINIETVGFTQDYYHLSTIQFIARVARYMKEGAGYIGLEALSPSTTIEFPTAIENMGRQLQNKRIDWTANEDEFVRRGFEAIFGAHWPFAEWLKVHRTGFNFPYRSLTRVRFLASLYKFADIEEVNDTGLQTMDECQREDCFRLSPRKLIDNVLQIYELISINERDEKWLRLAGLQGKIGPKVDLRNIAYKYIDDVELSVYSGVMSPLDFTFQMINAVSVDKTYVPGLGTFIVEPAPGLERRRVPVPMAADFFFSHCYSAGRTLYPAIHDFQDDLEKYFRREVQRDWLRRQEMVEASKAVYQEDLAKGQPLHHFHLFAEGETEMPYLSTHYQSNFRAQWVEFFEQKTQGFYSLGQDQLLCRELR